MKIIIESPFSAVDSKEKRRYITYARRAVLDSLKRGESPIAFHLWFPNYLDDNLAEDRDQGIRLSQEWYSVADGIAVYADLGTSTGMLLGIQHAAQLGLPLTWRLLYKKSKKRKK